MLYNAQGVPVRQEWTPRPLLPPGPDWVLVPSHTGARGDRGSVPHHADFNVTNALTVECWVRIPAVGVNFPVVTCKGVINSAFQLNFDEFSTNKMVATINTGTTASATDAVAPARDTWIHYAFTYDGTTIRLIKDGSQIATTAKTGNIVANSNPLYIGDADTLGANTWGSALSDLRIWNIVRSPATIAAEMSQRLVGNESGLVGYWPLNDGFGRVAASPVGSVKDCALSNGGMFSQGAAF